MWGGEKVREVKTVVWIQLSTHMYPSPVPYVPRLPRKVEVDVSKYHACHVKRTWMCQSATPATQSAATDTQSAATCRQVPRLPRKTPATATQSAATCRQVPRLPRKTPATATQSAATCPQVPRLPRDVQLHVAKFHACHAKRRGATAPHLKPSAPPEPAQCHTCHACHAKCVQVPHLPRKTNVDVSKCHACHAKCRYRHAKCSYMSPSATPATRSAATCRQVPRLPRKTPRRMAPHLKPSVPLEPAQCHKCHACHAKCSDMSPSAVPATQSAATCRQVPGLPRKTPRRHGATPKTKRATRASPVPYVPRLERGCVKVPRLPRKVKIDIAWYRKVPWSCVCQVVWWQVVCE